MVFQILALFPFLLIYFEFHRADSDCNEQKDSTYHDSKAVQGTVGIEKHS
jgi:hypothetical protein